MSRDLLILSLSARRHHRRRHTKLNCSADAACEGQTVTNFAGRRVVSRKFKSEAVRASFLEESKYAHHLVALRRVVNSSPK